MSKQYTSEQLNEINKLSDQNRADYFIKEVIHNNQIWILTDEHGCVMLNTEDEDCVPVWPSPEFAALWATKEWQACKPEAISLNKWFSRWTTGLVEDEIAVVIFPSKEEQGMVYDPQDFDHVLQTAKKKQKKNNN
ncbi:DUF2750 domain-containing protein [Thalassotalea piscium]|uniref:DUF2750 domain-containing protein n=1 Tax=Thalassotalea piscium TaxID=1230533 RepID=A0A7X0NES1_9GAMM|nr:DUF2750 domain-containing protein [Thalassotalea piscium]MBB6542112.1 hypothetical protein [Thalassotalea piscium]